MSERYEGGDGKKVGQETGWARELIAEDDVGDAVSLHDRSDGPGQACSSASSPQLGAK